jgi:hypothetical protein
VNYHTGKMRSPSGQTITMAKSGAVWQIPVLPPPKHTVLAATTTAPTNVTPPLDNMRDVEHMHEVLCCAGTTPLSWHGIRQCAQGRCSRIQMPHQSTHAGRRYSEKAPPTDRQLGHKGGTCACGALGRRGRFLCVLCRPAA